jgi:ABC-type lipoprotein export system ATPase subunit
MLELSGINVHYGKMHVLHGVSLQLAAGEVAALVGPNAAGKTTTLRTLVGFKECTTGTIRFGNEIIERLATADRIRLGIALVPEGRQVFPKFSVFENLRIGAFHRSDRDHLDADFESVFALFPKLAERRHQKAGLMSGGEQQMLAIGRGLMARPRLLLLDPGARAHYRRGDRARHRAPCRRGDDDPHRRAERGDGHARSAPGLRAHIRAHIARRHAGRAGSLAGNRTPLFGDVTWHASPAGLTRGSILLRK